VRGSVVLPHGLGGKARSVLVFAEGEKAKEAQAAGRDFVGGPELVEKVNGGWTEFDVAGRGPRDDAPRGQARPRARPAGQDAVAQGRHR
jgi:hypothetical protein